MFLLKQFWWKIAQQSWRCTSLKITCSLTWQGYSLRWLVRYVCHSACYEIIHLNNCNKNKQVYESRIWTNCNSHIGILFLWLLCCILGQCTNFSLTMEIFKYYSCETFFGHLSPYLVNFWKFVPGTLLYSLNPEGLNNCQLNMYLTAPFTNRWSQLSSSNLALFFLLPCIQSPWKTTILFFSFLLCYS